MSFKTRTAAAGAGPTASSSPFSRLTLLCLLSLVLAVSVAKASVYDFSYRGVYDLSVWGTGSFTTGPPYGSNDGYEPILSFSGTTNVGMIGGLVTSGGTFTDPGNGNYLYCCAFDYDNSFLPGGVSGGDWFSSSGGPLFTVADAPDSPINLFGDGSGDTYEFNYGQNTPNFNLASFGGTLIDFVVTPYTVAPEPGLYGAMAIGLAGLALAGWRLRRTS